METATATKVTRTTLKLSIRRKKSLTGLPGDDPSQHNLKIGSSIKNKAPLSGLTIDEERKYLPSILGVDSKAANFGLLVKDYWSNISERVPADEEAVGTDLAGRVIEFTMEFPSSSLADKFNTALGFEEKAEISKKGTCIQGVNDFVLWRYCIVYGRVANSLEDVGKSRKILFYMYSKSVEAKKAHGSMQTKLQAQNKFSEIMAEEALVDSLLRMFKQTPEMFEDIESKHMALFNFVESQPGNFLAHANDKNVKIKGIVLEAVNYGIIYNPPNTENYYYGDNKEVYLGGSLNDVAVWWKTKKGETEEEIKSTIVALIKEKRE